jgi:putative addiction module component (TIGR02574 family)
MLRFYVKLCNNLRMQVAEILKYSVAERIQIVEDIWDSISNSPESLELSDAEKNELDKRLDSYQETPNEGIEWETLKAKVLQSR